MCEADFECSVNLIVVLLGADLLSVTFPDTATLSEEPPLIPDGSSGVESALWWVLLVLARSAAQFDSSGVRLVFLAAPGLDFVIETVGPSGSIGFKIEIEVLLVPSVDPSVVAAV